MTIGHSRSRGVLNLDDNQEGTILKLTAEIYELEEITNHINEKKLL